MVSLVGQFPLETWSQYVPFDVILIEELVAFVLHRNVALVEVSLSVSVAPTHSVVSLPRFTTGGAF